jgi:hypothetical protein
MLRIALYALCWLWGRVDKAAYKWAKRREARKLAAARHEEAVQALQAKVYPFRRRQA